MSEKMKSNCRLMRIGTESQSRMAERKESSGKRVQYFPIFHVQTQAWAVLG